MYDSIDSAMDVSIFRFTGVQFNLASKLHYWHLGWLVASCLQFSYCLVDGHMKLTREITQNSEKQIQARKAIKFWGVPII
jgi:hypothetical protein